MKRAVVLQSPAHLYEVVPIFYKELQALDYFDVFYIVTDQKSPYGLGDNCVVVELEKDFGRAENFKRLLEVVKEDVFVMMCDDHVILQQYLDIDFYYALMDKNPRLGRLQLSPPSLNYARHMRKKLGAYYLPDYSAPFEVYDRAYRFYVNFQPALWRKDFFEFCISGGENRNKLELRASMRGRGNKDFDSGFIHEHAMQVGNFYASCKVSNAKASFNRQKDMAHYREEFVLYARKHHTYLDPSKNVYVKRRGFVASVPLNFYLSHADDVNALKSMQISQTFSVRSTMQLASRLRNYFLS